MLTLNANKTGFFTLKANLEEILRHGNTLESTGLKSENIVTNLSLIFIAVYILLLK